MLALHTHTHYSNFRLLDSMNKVKPLIDYALKLGLNGLAITDHEALSSHVEAIQYTKDINKMVNVLLNPIFQKAKEAYNLKDNEIVITLAEKIGVGVDVIKKTIKNMHKIQHLKQDFKMILGNEIYLMDDEECGAENYISGKTKFYHFVLLAKNEEGHKQLRELSSLAWDNSYWTAHMERVPTKKSDFKRIIQGGNIIGTTACIGGFLPQMILQLNQAEKEKKSENEIKEIKYKIHNFINFCWNVLGKENFFFEIQPSNYIHELDKYNMLNSELQNATNSTYAKIEKERNKQYYKMLNSEQQVIVNKKMLYLADVYNIKTIVTTDAHYQSIDDRNIHSSFLNAKDGEREVSEFYSTTYVMSEQEIKSYLPYLQETDIDIAIENTNIVGNMIENYDLYHSVVVPRMTLPQFTVQHIFSSFYNSYPYIEKFACSEDEQDRYLLHLIEHGCNNKLKTKMLSSDYLHVVLDRINIELTELWEITKEIQTKLSAYYITTREVIQIMWNEGDSLVGIARGSSTGFLIAYLIDITQMNPIQWNLPHWRHLTRTRAELPDIDIDSQASKRKQILEAMKQILGYKKVLPICTFGTEGSRSALLTSCRGLGIDNDTAQSLADFIPFERGSNWSLSDCLEGNEDKDRRPIKEFIFAIHQYEGLKETALAIEGLVTKRSIHASGIYIFDDDYIKYNASMKAPNGQIVTQFNMTDSDYMGGLKVDVLTIEALDKERVCMELLIKNGYMQWQGSLKATYDKYIHPDVLDYDTPEMWQMIGKNEITDLFQMETDVGSNASKKVKPTNLLELAVTNSLMRLVSDNSTEQPVDTYVKFKNNLNLWYAEMNSYSLTEEEIHVLEKHLKHLYGVADTQEVVMQLSMDEKIAGFDLRQANKLRKGIAKKKSGVQDEVKKMFFDMGIQRGTSYNLLNYVWNVQIKRQLGYSFSLNHTAPYSCIALQEMNLAYHYPILFWNTACLTVNAGADEDNDDNKGTNYGKVATAISTMQHKNIKIELPDINKADFSFKPDLENNSIVFGLKAIHGIGNEVVDLIIHNRPYIDLNDFIAKMIDTNIIKSSQMIQLIKAGSFDSFGDRVQIMQKYILMTNAPRTNLTLQNINMLLTYNLIPEDKMFYIDLMTLKKLANKNKRGSYEMTEKIKGKRKNEDNILFVPNDYLYLVNSLDHTCILEFKEDGCFVSEYKLNKTIDMHLEHFKQWLKQDTVLLNNLNQKILKDIWSEKCEGSISAWEMESLCIYYHEHELQHANKNKYSISNFFELNEVPEVAQTFYKKNKECYKFKLTRIVGTVLDKNKVKHMVTLLTSDGVVTLKLYDGAFQHYDKQLSKVNEDGSKTIVEKSWFSRGTKLLVTGHRLGNTFRPKKYVDSIFQHTIVKINNIDDNGDLDLQLERFSEGDNLNE